MFSAKIFFAVGVAIIAFLVGTALLLFISSNRKWEIYEMAFSIIFLLVFLKPLNKEIYTSNE